MNQASDPEPEQMKSEYEFQGGVRGKYLKHHEQGTNVVLLDLDVAAVFHDSESVNRALRQLIRATNARQVSD